MELKHNHNWILGIVTLLALSLPACKNGADSNPEVATENTDDSGTGTAVDTGGDSGTGTGSDIVTDTGSESATDPGTGTLDPETDTGECKLSSTDTDPEFVSEIGCRADYDAVASKPVSESIPGARSVKTVIDQLDSNTLYFQNSRRYMVHYDFASSHCSGHGLPMVPALSEFNKTEYFSPDRRFLLGALNYYEGPKTWAYEIAPYDTASAEMIATAFNLIKTKVWMGERLVFHPTSDEVAVEAAKLPASIPVVTTDQLFEGIDYQPLNLGTAMGQLRFFDQATMETGYVSFRDIAVIDAIPNDISVCSGIITSVFQTPLSHINVLSQNRGTPNMGLKGAFNDPALRALEGKWVELMVGPFEYAIREVTKAEADTWWNAHKPIQVQVPAIDLSVTDIPDIEDVLDLETLSLADALHKALPAFGGKASHFAAIPHITSTPIRYPEAFVVPVYYYDQFMKENGFYARIETMLADPAFKNDPAVRRAKLTELQDAIKAAPVNAAFEAKLLAKLAAHGNIRMKFRSSTNSEDLEGFTGAGLYTSEAGDINDPTHPVLNAVRKVWASIWNFRAFEERDYRSIAHKDVAMALLVNRSFPTEAANGVAVTANIFDPKGVEPGFYVNAQKGDTSVVIPPSDGTTSDQFIFHYDMTGQPIVFIEHSSLVPAGTTVLTRAQTIELGKALEAIHAFFSEVYGPMSPTHFYAMDVEWKFDQGPTDAAPLLYIKQARPYPGRGE